MSWLFSRALVEASSAAGFSDGEPSAQLNVMPTPHKFWRNDKTMEPSNLSRFGLTLRLLTDAHGEALLTSFRAGFPARTSAPPARERASTAAGPDSGRIWLASFAKYSPLESSWRTAQYSLLEDSGEFSETWPRWGSMRNGESFLRPTPALTICANAFGLWPTPTVCGNNNAPGISPTSGWGLASAAKLWPTPTVPNGGRTMSREMALNGGYTMDGVKRQVGLENAVRYWPTPVASDTGLRTKRYAQGGTPLSMAAAMWPTPTASLAHKGGRITQRKGREGGTLIEAVSARMFPTPAARDYRSPNANPYSERGGGKKGEQLPNFIGGLLNPTWVEWLMGWPIGWTELKPLEMDKYREWQQQHSPCSAGNYTASNQRLFLLLDAI